MSYYHGFVHVQSKAFRITAPLVLVLEMLASLVTASYVLETVSTGFRDCSRR